MSEKNAEIQQKVRSAMANSFGGLPVVATTSVGGSVLAFLATAILGLPPQASALVQLVTIPTAATVGSVIQRKKDEENAASVATEAVNVADQTVAQTTAALQAAEANAQQILYNLQQHYAAELSSMEEVANDNYQKCNQNYKALAYFRNQLISFWQTSCNKACADLQKVSENLLQEADLVKFRKLKAKYEVLEQPYDNMIAKCTLIVRDTAGVKVFLQSCESRIEDLKTLLSDESDDKSNNDVVRLSNLIVGLQTDVSQMSGMILALQALADELHKLVEAFLHDAIAAAQSDTSEKKRADAAEQKLKSIRDNSAAATKNAANYSEALAMLEQSHKLNRQFLFTLRGWQIAAETLPVNLPTFMSRTIAAFRKQLVAQNVSLALLDLSLPASENARDRQIAMKLMVIPELNDANTLEDVEVVIESGIPEDHGSIQYSADKIGTINTQQVAQLIGKIKLSGARIHMEDCDENSRQLVVFIGATEADINALKAERARNPNFFNGVAGNMGQNFMLGGGHHTF